jgi:MFS family permease
VLQADYDVISVALNPLAFIEVEPFAGNGLERVRWSANTGSGVFWRWCSWWPSLFSTIPSSSHSAVLSHFYKVPSERIGLYLLPLAIGNFCGPLFLGTLFDTVGRKAMIAGTFAISGLLLLLTAYLFAAGNLTPVTQTIAWFSIFFFASAAARRAGVVVDHHGGTARCIYQGRAAGIAMEALGKGRH